MRIFTLITSLFILILVFFILFPTTKPVSATHGMVVSEQQIASQVGVNILRNGGNAIDAAVAVGYALAVVHSCCGNLGGGGFMVLHLANGNNTFINFREKAPYAATKTMFLDAKGNVRPNASLKGFLAVGVPGTVMGLDTALNLYGTMTRQQVMAPAIQLAKQGYAITAFDAKWMNVYANGFRSSPNVAAIFLQQNQPYQVGQVLKQPALAQTLELIATYGAEVFYNGIIAKKIVAASTANGGILSLKDFADYNIELSAPLNCSYHGYTIYTAAPPGSGVTLCEMLNILQHFNLSELELRSAKRVRTIVEAMRFGFADRNSKLGDPNFVQNPVSELLSENYAAKISEKIKAQPDALTVENFISTEKPETTHYSVIDAKDNAVAVTYTINGFYGAKVIAGDTGFFLNDEMDDFTVKPGTANDFGLVQSEMNAIQPGKRPLSSMTPTIVMKDGKVTMILGSRGGPRILTSVLLTLLNVLDKGMNIQQAVNAARFHFQGMPNLIFIEPGAISFFGRLWLEYRNYQFDKQSPWSSVEAISVDPTTKTIYGANDARTPAGAAEGY